MIFKLINISTCLAEQEIATKNVNLSVLNEFIDSTLDKAQIVQNILQTECDQAELIFSPWKVETEIDEKIEKECICVKEIDITKQVEEIANEIDKTLAQVKEFRQKSKKTENKFPCKGSQASKNISLNKKVPVKPSAKSTSHSVVKNVSNSVTKKSSPINFIAQNKLHVKTLSKQNSKMTQNQIKSEKSDSKISVTKTISELDNLIQKVSLNSFMTNESESLTEMRKKCPCQGGDENIVKKKVQLTLNMIDYFNRFSIPNNLLKILQIYYSYVNSQADKNIEKKQTAVQIFLDTVEKKNEVQSLKLPKLTDHLGKLIKSFFKLYQYLDKTKPCDFSTLEKIKSKYRELNDLTKTYKINENCVYESDNNLIDNNDCHYIARGWLSNGIWNWSSNCFSMFTETNCIKYSNNNQLLTFINLTQQFQQIMYQNNLHDLILCEIIPKIKNNRNLSDEETIHLCKMIYVIIQVLNPKMMTVAKTES